MSEINLLHQINNKLTRGNDADFPDLQCISIYAHNESSGVIKSLKVNDNDELVVVDNSSQTTFTDSPITGSLAPGATFTSDAIQITKAREMDILVSAPANINQLATSLLVSDDGVNFFDIDTHFVTAHTHGNAQFIKLEFKVKYVKIQLENTSGSNTIDYTVSYAY